jgi:hypothetical protein
LANTAARSNPREGEETKRQRNRKRKKETKRKIKKEEGREK